MLNLKFGLSALLLEAAAWSGPALLRERSDLALASYLGAHALASVLLALALLPFMAAERARPRWAVLALTACFSFAVPVAGFAGAVLATLVLYVYRTPARPADFGSLQLPEFDLHQRIQGSFRQAGLHSFLSNARVPEQSRMGAMVALQFVPGRVATPLLRGMLGDASEDLRLLAYGMLDVQEKRITRAIDAQLQVLAEAQDGTGDHVRQLHLDAAQHLCDLYWELVYQNLVQGDLRAHAVQESLRYCRMVLEQRPGQPQLVLRQGRLLHAQGQLQDAARAYAQAHAMGLPATRILPYQAELAFAQRDFAQTAQLVRGLDQWDALPRLRPVIDYWSART